MRFFSGKSALAILLTGMLLLHIGTPAFSQSTPIKVRAESDAAPFSYDDDMGLPAGFSIEVLQAVARSEKLILDIKIAPWPTIREDIESERADVLVNMAYSPERDLKVDYSSPYLLENYAIFIRKGSSISGPSDVIGKKIAVQRSDILHDIIIREMPDDNILPAETYQEALKAVASETVDCAILPVRQTRLLIHRMGLDNLTEAEDSYRTFGLHFAVREGDLPLAARLNDGLQKIKSDGTYYRIYEHWFGIGHESRLLRWIRWHILPISLVLATLSGLIVSWIFLLRRTVRLRTKELQQQLEERRRAEEMLRVKEERLKLALSANGLGIWDWNTETGEVYRNKRLWEMIGYSRTEKSADVYSWSELIHPEDRDRVFRIMEDYLAGHIEKYDTEYRLQTKLQRWKWIADSARIVEWNKEGYAKRVIGVHRDISERKRAEAERSRLEDKLRRAAITDKLTGAMNRQHFDHEIDRTIVRSRRSGEPFSLIMADIDHFKRINDDFGHLVGDSILIRFCEQIMANIRSSDIFARWGGEEFFILTSQEGKSAAKLAEKLRRKVETTVFDNDISLTASFGVAKFSNGMTQDDIIGLADSALYRAKSLGRNRIEIAEQPLS